jgi:hypothetical protein
MGDAFATEKKHASTVDPSSEKALTPSTHSVLDSLLAGVGNQAVQRSLTANATPVIRFDPERPWLYSVDGPWSAAEITRELYGADLSAFEESEQTFDLSTLKPRSQHRLMPDLLREAHRNYFHALMAALLHRDARVLEDWLLDAAPHEASKVIGDHDPQRVMTYLRFWAGCKDMRAPSGDSYFDEFLSRLQRDTWHTDYLLWNSSSHPYLDLVYSVGNPIDVHLLVGANSVRYGFYRPPSLEVSSGTATATEVQRPLDPQYVQRASDMVMDRLVGSTPAAESHETVQLLLGLPPHMQAQVLTHFMQRYGDNETELLIFSRSGEPTATHMLFWLFEDLTSEDRQKLANAFRASGLMKPEVIDALVEGRTWAGRNLPTTTYYGEQAAQLYADKYTQGSGLWAIPGFFASLWTPTTASQTILTLTGARVFPALAETSPLVGKTLLLAGTGVGAFQTTLAVQGAVTGKDPWSGKPLSFEDQLASMLYAVSGALLLSAGFMAAASMRPGSALAPVERPSMPRFEARVLNGNPQTGEFTGLVRDTLTGEIYSVQGNANTGNATVTNLTNGQVVGYFRGGVFGPAAPGGALPSGTSTAGGSTGGSATGGGAGSTVLAPGSQPALPAGSVRPLPPGPTRPLLEAPKVPVEQAQALTPENVDYVIKALQARRSLSPDEVARVRQAAQTKGEKWNLPDALRGEVAHVLGGENLPPTFETIDVVGPIDEKGLATEITSIKSRQPYTASLSKPGGFLSELESDIDALASYRARLRGTTYVRAGPNTIRVLEVEVPPDTLSPAEPGRPQGDAALREQWRSEAEAAIKYARSKGVVLRFRAATK